MDESFDGTFFSFRCGGAHKEITDGATRRTDKNDREEEYEHK